jgi:hypothetical protein
MVHIKLSYAKTEESGIVNDQVSSTRIRRKGAEALLLHRINPWTQGGGSVGECWARQVEIAGSELEYQKACICSNFRLDQRIRKPV